jgi:hypothetical protein
MSAGVGKQLIAPNRHGALYGDLVRMPSGSPGAADIFGSQQYGPLLDIDAPDGS